ncbi:hypothetical protein J2S43_005504 [Catenuloplanes nepalensis]|uniref:DUF3558 domain-containing protein n=1 Tax=Catenuloplanes nepalensis TaxID=587533 RepID=A0ABT9MZW9_9ACTN|nr:hypothetical protein [Catenuloplanes nepalensis]MDP9796992.1 hypothetical protein [Catenuloplanes nepalensis]
MRNRLMAATLGLLLAVTGCNNGGTQTDAGPPVKARVDDAQAEIAGGACELLNFGVVHDFLDVEFNVSAAGEQKETITCVLQQGDAPWPDLSLAVSETSADPDIFASDVKPEGAEAVKDLGKAAYKIVSDPAKDHGPSAEIGWLSSNGRILMLRYTFAKDQQKAAATDIAPVLVDMAKDLDATLIAS